MNVSPTCTIIAGVNGAGKTTFALDYLAHAVPCRAFINVDLIAAGLSPLAPERKQLAASRLFLREIKASVSARENFAFETTLAGRGYLRLVHNLQSQRWRVELIYLYLPHVQLSLDRVAERARHGGHDIPPAVVVRRYPRSLANFINHYLPLCKRVICLDNSHTREKVVLVKDEQGLVVKDEVTYRKLQEQSREGN